MNFIEQNYLIILFIYIIGEILSLLLVYYIVKKDSKNTKECLKTLLFKTPFFVFGSLLFSWWMIVLLFFSCLTASNK